MFDGKFIATLIALVVSVIAICNFNTKKTISHEGFLPSRQVRKELVMASNQEAVAKGDFYSVPANYQAMLSPRFDNSSVGSNIRYNPPAYKNRAVFNNPLTFGDMATENFNNDNIIEGYGCGSGGSPNDYHGGAPIMKGDFASGNYNQIVKQVTQENSYPDATDMLPVGTMATVNELGEATQPIVFDRFIYANRNSRLRSQGDKIRGDLPIVPCSADWFRPSVHPSIDLEAGALNVMAGIDNGTAQAMADLINATSSDTTIGGVNMASMKNTFTGQAMGNVSVTAFP